MATDQPTRRYRGAAPDERRARRRADLIQAAIEVYGDRGYRQATVKAVCDAAGLTERYFYESFDSSEALLAACYETVTQAFFAELRRAGATAGKGQSKIERMRVMLVAYFSTLQGKPRSAQLFLTEIHGIGPIVDAAFDAALREFGRSISAELLPKGRPRQELLEAAVVGGVMHIALRWIADGYRPSIPKVADIALRLCRLILQRPGVRRLRKAGV